MRNFFILPALCGALASNGQELPRVDLHTDVHGIFDKDLLSSDFHAGRRQALRDSLPSGGVAVLFANPVRNRSNDVDYEYHQDPDLYYLTGHREPHALLILAKEPFKVNGKATNELLVVEDRDPRREVWEGRKLGAEGAAEVLKVNMAISGVEFLQATIDHEQVQQFFVHRINGDLANDPHRPADLSDLMDHMDQRMEQRDAEVIEQGLDRWMAAMREIKEPEEIVLLRKAIEITCQAQNELMSSLEPGMSEYQTEAIIEYIFKSNGAEYEGFPSIQGGGPHSCVLHYVTNRRELGPNDLLVSDVGAEYHGYTADVTRTMPANGKFSDEQRAIYDLVLQAQNAGIAAAQVGNVFWAPHQAAMAVVAAGLKSLGIIAKEKDASTYFMHGTSHYLGLDVHDAGTYGPLMPNTVITVEPGIYIAEGSPCDPRWWNIGIRIEDDILITPEGPVNLSAASPRKAEEVEAMMGKEKEGRVR